MAAAAIGGGAGFMAGRGQEAGPLPRFRPATQRSDMATPSMGEMYPVMPMASTALSGQAPGAGSVFAPPAAPAPRTAAPQKAAGKAGKKGKEQGPPMPAEQFDPNLNYLVTQALDQLLGGGEAERGRQYQQYYSSQGYY